MTRWRRYPLARHSGRIKYFNSSSTSPRSGRRLRGRRQNRRGRAGCSLMQSWGVSGGERIVGGPLLLAGRGGQADIYDMTSIATQFTRVKIIIIGSPIYRITEASKYQRGPGRHEERHEGQSGQRLGLTPRDATDVTDVSTVQGLVDASTPRRAIPPRPSLVYGPGARPGACPPLTRWERIQKPLPRRAGAGGVGAMARSRAMTSTRAPGPSYLAHKKYCSIAASHAALQPVRRTA